MADKIPLKVSFDAQGVPIGIAEYGTTDTMPQSRINGLPAAIASKEDAANKSTNTALGASDTLYPSQKAVKAYVDNSVVGLLDDRGSYDASVNTYPAAGGSGAAGAILKGDVWYISAAGTLGGEGVAIGSAVRALVDSPGQTAGHWSIMTGTSDIAGLTHAATSKATPVDADELPLVDSAASNVLKKLTCSNLKATLAAYIATLYVALTGDQTIAGVKTFASVPALPLPAFRAKRVTSEVTLTAATWVIVTWNDDSSSGYFDTANAFGVTTNVGRHTPTTPGYYLYAAAVKFQGSTDQNYMQVNLAKNAASAGTGMVSQSTSYASGTAGNTIIAHALVYMNGTTDYMEVHARSQSGTMTDALGGGSSFEGIFLRT